jgi:hypothetical protein
MWLGTSLQRRASHEDFLSPEHELKGLGMMVHTSNPSTGEAKAGASSLLRQA